MQEFNELAPGIYLTNGIRTVPVTATKAVSYASYNDLFAQPGQQDTEAEELAKEVAWLRACYERRADKVSGLPRVILDKTEKEIDESGLAFDLTGILWRIEYALNLYGAAYLFKRRNMRGETIDLQWLDPATMEPLANEQQGLYAFRRNLSSPRVYMVESTSTSPDVAWVWLPGMREAAPGEPLAVTLRLPGEVLRALDRYADAFFDQGAMPITLLRVPTGTSDAERDRLEGRFARMAAGIRNAFRPVAVRSAVEVERLGTIPSDLAMADLTMARRDAILAATGVPISVVMGTAVNYATAAQEAVNFVSNVIAPRAKLIERALNRHIFNAFGWRLRFQPEQLSEMQKDENASAQAFATLRSGGMSREAAAYFLGYSQDDLPEGMVMFEEVPIPLLSAEPEEEDDNEEPDENALNDTQTAEDQDLQRWQRKAVNAFRSGKNAAVAFDSEHIQDAKAAQISTLLPYAQTEEEIKAVFDIAPFLGVAYA